MTKERSKRSYKRNEIIHAWVHKKKDAPEVIYYKDSRRSYNCVVGIGDYLFKGNKIDNTLDSVLKYWSGRNTCAAIINRKNKEAILYYESPLYYDVISSIPEDWTVYTSLSCLKKDILNESEEVKLKLHAEYLIHELYKWFQHEFVVLNSNKKLYYYENVDRLYDDRKSFIEFTNWCIDKELYKYGWFDKVINEPIAYHIYHGWSYKKSIEVIPKSVKDITNREIFSSEQIKELKFRAFYTQYCYGKGISLKEVRKRYHTVFVPEKDIDNKYPISKEVYKDCDSWVSYVIARSKVLDAMERDVERKRIETNKRNREEALKNINYTNQAAKWRQGVNITTYISYYAWRKDKGHWEYKEVREYTNGIENTQLKLVIPFNTAARFIYTSRGCSVPYHDAVCLFRTFKYVIDKHKDEEEFEMKFSDKNIMCGYYKLLRIFKGHKFKDNQISIPPSSREYLDKVDWCIVIGCHYIWYEDILDFIKYYKLEKDFGI